MSTYSVLKSAETKTAHIEVCSDQIVRVLFKKEASIDVIQLKVLMDTYNELTQGTEFAYIYYTEDGIANLDGEAKKFGKLNPNYFKKHCIAVVVKSLPQRIMANFYLKVIQSETPYKVFNSLKEAEKWCVSVIQKKKAA